MTEPLFFVPFFEEKPWGGDRLNQLFEKYPADIPIGESWELSSVTYRQTFVRSGEFAGTMLSDLFERNPGLFGIGTPCFPFVIKLMDTRVMTPLIVQRGGAKSDASHMGVYVVSVDKPVPIVSGTSLHNKLELFNAIAGNTLAETLRYTYVDTGDSYMVQPGTFYAIGGGALAYTINSPLIENERDFDWSAYSGFELDKIVDSFQFDMGTEKFVQQNVSEGRDLVLECALFKVERIDASLPRMDKAWARFAAFTALGGGCLRYVGGEARYHAGETFIVPAGFGEFSLEGGTLLKAVAA
ncbi:MAG: hypothetical protein LBD12_00100 [Clostridiales Family XIII bacterium]|jgi:mannose-6-phosphate isomerase|nr:hypothetical protein [Clostridiales Family XIII bacterium]